MLVWVFCLDLWLLFKAHNVIVAQTLLENIRHLPISKVISLHAILQLRCNCKKSGRKNI